MGKKLQIEEMGRLSPEAFQAAAKIPVILLLDRVRSMNNVGAMFRTADAFRLEKLLLCGITPTPPHREINKTALGAEHSVAWEAIADAVTAAQTLQAAGYTLLALEQAEGSEVLGDFSVDPAQKYVLMIGHEIDGVTQELIDMAAFTLEIPQFGTKHSLNVAVAAGIALHHLAMGFHRGGGPS